MLEPFVDGGLGREPLRHVAGFVLEVENDAVGHPLMELVGVDVGAEDIPCHQLVLAQERRAGEADEDCALHPALHLLVHVAALGAVAFVHEYVKTAGYRRPAAFESFYYPLIHVLTLLLGTELVDKGTKQARAGCGQFRHELVSRDDARGWRLGADDAGILHHTFDLLVQLVAVGDDEDAGVRVVFQQPLGDQHHDDALAAPLGVPDDTTFPLADARLGGLHGEELVRPRYLLLAGVEDDEVADQIEQPRLVAHLDQRPVEQRSGDRRRAGRLGSLVFPLHEELFRRTGGAVAEPLRVAAGEYMLHGAEEVLVEDLFLVGNELAHAVANLHRAALQLDHRDGDAVEIEHNVRPALVASLQRHLFGQREVVFLRVLPVDQVHRFVGLARGDLYRHAVAQELVGAQVRLVERDARRVGGGLELLEGGGDVGAGVATGRQVVAE